MEDERATREDNESPDTPTDEPSPDDGEPEPSAEDEPTDEAEAPEDEDDQPEDDEPGDEEPNTSPLTKARERVAGRWSSGKRRMKRRRDKAVKWVRASHVRQWTAWLVGAAVVELVVVAILLALDLDWINWGNVPEWVGANMTAAAVSLALATSISDRRDRERERKELEDERREQEKRQARLVFVEIKDDQVVITNYSDRPVFRLSAKVSRPGFNLSAYVTASFLVRNSARVPDLNVLEAGKNHGLDAPNLPSKTEIQTYLQRPAWDALSILGHRLPTVEVRLTDAEGNKWRCVHSITNAEEPKIYPVT